MHILMYHQIVPGRPPNVHAVNAGEFARQLRWLRQAGYRPLYPEDGLPGAGRAPGRTVAVTFDDGYRDFQETALPILREHGFVATVFLLAGLMGGCRNWIDGDDASCPPFLTWAEARQAAPHGVRFGSHTLSHPDLTALAPAEVERELIESRRLIEDQTGQPVAAFSYPFGRQSPRIRGLVRDCGYRLACAGPVGYAGAAGGDPYCLNRITVLATDTLDDFARKVRGGLPRRLAWHARRARSRLRRALGV